MLLKEYQIHCMPQIKHMHIMMQELIGFVNSVIGYNCNWYLSGCYYRGGIAGSLLVAARLNKYISVADAMIGVMWAAFV